MAVKHQSYIPTDVASDSGGVPRHIGFIIDGNRRWARERGLPTLEGHRRGYALVARIGREALGRGVSFVSAYMFSTENWSRSTPEVDYLMNELHTVATRDAEELHASDIRVRFVGSRRGLPDNLRDAIERAEALTRRNEGGTLAYCVNYGGHTEIVDAVAGIIESGAAAGEVTPELVEQYLYAPELTPIDLLIRTGGEKRLSNFMMWRVAYAELRFLDMMWPAFGVDDLDAALADYAVRNRRFGQ